MTRRLTFLLVIITVWGSMLPFKPASAAIQNIGPGGCPANTVVGGDNLVQNGDFSQGTTGFTSALINRGPGVYPDDNNGGGFSIQNGSVVHPPSRKTLTFSGVRFRVMSSVMFRLPIPTSILIRVLIITALVAVALTCGHKSLQ